MNDSQMTRKQLIQELCVLRQRVGELERLETERREAEDQLRHSLEKLHQAVEETVQAMALTVETRDPYTAGHQQRVAKFACAIGTEMGLAEDQIEGIRLAALIHDIGKLYIPVEFLSKPGGLSEIEFAIIKEHCRVGYEILKSIEFPRPVSQTVLQHHERMDGSGYPNGLEGDEILVDARILAVADVVEAMVSHRPYRPALGVEAALDEINQNRNVLYDPEPVSACVELLGPKRFAFAN